MRTVPDVDLTITMSDYANGMIESGVKPEFDTWLREQDIAEMSCFELTLLGEKPAALCQCYIREGRTFKRRPDAPSGWRMPETPEYIAHDFLEVRTVEVWLTEPPPASLLQYLATREQ